jgi:hypothetical protein
MLGRKGARHQTVRSVAAGSHDAWYDFQPGQRVQTIDGFPGKVVAVQDGPHTGNEAYDVVLDNGLGGGLYTSSQLKAINEKTADVHTAADDYPELGTILHERPDIAPNQVLAVNHWDQYSGVTSERPSSTGGTCLACGIGETRGNPVCASCEQSANANHHVPGKTPDMYPEYQPLQHGLAPSLNSKTAAEQDKECPDCDGMGVDPDGGHHPDDDDRCQTCKGRGAVSDKELRDHHFRQVNGSVPEHCTVCHGDAPSNGIGFKPQPGSNEHQNRWVCPTCADRTWAGGTGNTISGDMNLGWPTNEHGEETMGAPFTHKDHTLHSLNVLAAKRLFPCAYCEVNDNGQGDYGKHCSECPDETAHDLEAHGHSEQEHRDRQLMADMQDHLERCVNNDCMGYAASLHQAEFQESPHRSHFGPMQDNWEPGAWWSNYTNGDEAQHGFRVQHDGPEENCQLCKKHAGLGDRPGGGWHFGPALDKWEPGTASAWSSTDGGLRYLPKHMGEKDDCPQCNSHPVHSSLIAIAAEDADFRFHITASWSDVRNKAKGLRQAGRVRILAASDGYIAGEVLGENHVYSTVLQRLPGSIAAATWECGCRWAAYAWGRSPAYKRFEGRMCSHALAMQYEAMSRGMFGREIEEDTQRPGWQRASDGVVVRWDKSKQRNDTRRANPPGNMRRTFSSVDRQLHLTPAHLDENDDNTAYCGMPMDPQHTRPEVSQSSQGQCSRCMELAPEGELFHPQQAHPQADTRRNLRDFLSSATPPPGTHPSHICEHPGHPRHWIGDRLYDGCPGCEKDHRELNPEIYDGHEHELDYSRVMAQILAELKSSREDAEILCVAAGISREAIIELLPELLEAGEAAGAAGEAAGAAGEAAGAAGEGAGGGAGLKNLLKAPGGSSGSNQSGSDQSSRSGQPASEQLTSGDSYANPTRMSALTDPTEPALPTTSGDSLTEDGSPGGGGQEDGDLNGPSAGSGVGGLTPELEDDSRTAALAGNQNLSWIMAGTPSSGNSDIAAAAREHLAKIALKDFTPGEQAQLINEGVGIQAGNLDRLQIADTHYALLNNEEDDDSWLI